MFGRGIENENDTAALLPGLKYAKYGPAGSEYDSSLTVALPAALQASAVMSLNSARVRTPRHLQGPSYSDLVDSTQVPFTQFERLDGLNFAVLALDRIVRPEAFPASEKDALAAIERGNRVRSGSYQDRQWMIVVELDNASILVHPYKVKGEDKRTGIVSAKVGQVLLVGPDRSRISTLPASAFTLANR